MQTSLEIFDEFVYTTFDEPLIREVVHCGKGVYGVKEMPAKVVGKIAHRTERGTFTTLQVECEWPYGGVWKRDFAADDSLSLGSIREWKLVK